MSHPPRLVPPSHAPVALVILCAAVLVAACAGPKPSDAAAGTAAGKKSGEITIGYVTKSASNQGWVIINQGAADAAKEAGVKFKTVGPAQAESVSGQLAAIENMINQRIDALALAPVDSSAVAPAVEKANSAGIPVVAVDTAVNGAPVTSFVATDSVKAGQVQGQWAAANVPAGGAVAVVNGQLSQSTGKDRFDGFSKALKSANPKVTLYQVQTSWDQTQAQDGVEALLRAHPDIKLIANAWDGGTMGTVAAVQGIGKAAGDIKIIGIDGAPDALQQMQKGWVQADVGQRLYQEGYQGVMTAVKAARGDKVKTRIDTGETLITPANLAQFIKENHLTAFVKAP